MTVGELKAHIAALDVDDSAPVRLYACSYYAEARVVLAVEVGYDTMGERAEVGDGDVIDAEPCVLISDE